MCGLTLEEADLEAEHKADEEGEGESEGEAGQVRSVVVRGFCFSFKMTFDLLAHIRDPPFTVEAQSFQTNSRVTFH